MKKTDRTGIHSRPKRFHGVVGGGYHRWLQTMSKPLGSEKEAWKWVTDPIHYFKGTSITRDMLWALEQQVVINLPNSYRNHFADFLALAESMTPIFLACDQLLKQGKGQAAKDAADPYVKWLLALLFG